MAKDLQDCHNQGEQDAAEGNHYSPPNPSGFFNTLFFGATSEEISENESYKEGWENGRKQR